MPTYARLLKLALAGEDFPMRVGARYGVMADTNGGDHLPNVLDDIPALNYHMLGARDLKSVIADMLRYSRHAFLVFSQTQSEYASVYRTTPAGSLESLDRAVSRSPRFSLWFHNGDTRIYRLIDSAAVSRTVGTRHWHRAHPITVRVHQPPSSAGLTDTAARDEQ